MMKKKYLIHLVVLMLFNLLFIAGCSNKKQLTIGFLYPSDAIVRFNKESNFFKEYANKQGVSVIIEEASDDESIQIERGMELIEQGVDALVIIAVNVNTAAVIVREAHSEGIPVMAYNRMIKSSNVDFFLASNNDLIGKIMVDAVHEKYPEGKYVILGGNSFDKNGVDLQVAVKKYLKPHIESGSVNLIYETFIDQWNPSIAAFELEKIISLYGTDINAVIAGNDGMANAVIEVLEKYSLAGKVAVTGQDAEIIGCKNILSGKQIVTVFHPIQSLAEKAAEIAIEMAKGKSTERFANSSEYNGHKEIPTHRVNSIAVNEKNIEEELINSGFYRKEDLY